MRLEESPGKAQGKPQWASTGKVTMTRSPSPFSRATPSARPCFVRMRATGASVLALFQNLFGLAAGPFLAGVLSDQVGLATALTAIPAFGALAAVFFLLADQIIRFGVTLVLGIGR